MVLKEHWSMKMHDAERWLWSKLTNIIIAEGFGVSDFFRRHGEASEGERESQASTWGSAKCCTTAQIIKIQLHLAYLSTSRLSYVSVLPSAAASRWRAGQPPARLPRQGAATFHHPVRRVVARRRRLHRRHHRLH